MPKFDKNNDDEPPKSEYYLYILLCKDNSYYIGTTNNIQKRYAAHTSGKGAKYTASKKVCGVEALWKLENKSIAMSVESIIKQASKEQKRLFIKNTFALKKFYKDKTGISISIRRSKTPKL